MNILLVEDSPDLADAVIEFFKSHNHIINWAKDLKQAKSYLASSQYSIVILDLSLPDGNGLDLIKPTISKIIPSPAVIVVTAKDQINDRIDGLNRGADDYLVKPFDLNELLARINALYRRFSGQKELILEINNLKIDISSRRVFCKDQEVILTGKEWSILERLCQNPKQITKKSELQDAMYSFNQDIESNTIEVHVSQLRKKLGAEIIETVRGIGYKLKQSL